MNLQNIPQDQHSRISIRSIFTKTQFFCLCLISVPFFLSVFALTKDWVIGVKRENLALGFLAAGDIAGFILILVSFVVGIIRAFRKEFKMLVSSIVLLFIVIVFHCIAFLICWTILLNN